MVDNVKIVFVVLHYMAITETKECIKSIIDRIDTLSYKIIVVDNASPDGSGSDLEEQYKDKENVIVLKSTDNVGFANGNNIGYRYAKQYLKPDFIVLCNNDILLIQDNLVENIEKEFNVSGFALMGPLVLTKDGRFTSSPSRWKPLAKQEVQHMLADYVRCLWINRINLITLYYVVRKLLLRKKEYGYGHNCIDKQYGVSIHGCFMVFSSKYISKYDGLNPETFMYGEEEILYKTLQRDELVSVYNPNIVIFHKEDVSTNLIKNSKKKKREFYYSNLVKSTRILLSLYETGDDIHE